MEINYNLVPLEVREWIRTFSLSQPIGVGVSIAGGTALDLYRNKTPDYIDIWITGATILETANDAEEDRDLYHTFLTKLKQKHGFKQEDRYIISDCCDVVYGEVKDVKIKLFFVSPLISLNQLVDEFDFNICKMWVDDINTLGWEVNALNTTIRALELKMIILDTLATDRKVFDCDTSLSRQLRISDYRKKFPDFKIYKEM